MKLPKVMSWGRVHGVLWLKPTAILVESVFSFMVTTRQNMRHSQKISPIILPSSLFFHMRNFITSWGHTRYHKRQTLKSPGYHTRNVTSPSDSARHRFLPFGALLFAMFEGLPWKEKQGLVDGRPFPARPTTVAHLAPYHISQTNTPSLSHLKLKRS